MQSGALNELIMELQIKGRAFFTGNQKDKIQ